MADMDFYDIIVAQDETASRRQTQAQNAARLGYSAHKVGSKGTGTIRRPTPLMFQVVFLEEPIFLTGSTLVKRPADLSDPVGSAGVWQWHRNPKGHYTGAYIYLSVTLSDLFYEAGAGEVQMTHNLVFQGIGFKDLGQEVTTEAQIIVPRTVGFGA